MIPGPLGPLEIPAPPDLSKIFRPRSHQSAEHTIVIELVGVTLSDFDVLTVRTDMGEFDYLAGEAATAHYGTDVFILASVKNVGDLPGTCSIVCEYPVGVELWSWSGTLDVGDRSYILSIAEGTRHPFTMPATSATVRITSTP